MPKYLVDLMKRRILKGGIGRTMALEACRFLMGAHPKLKRQHGNKIMFENLDGDRCHWPPGERGSQHFNPE